MKKTKIAMCLIGIGLILSFSLASIASAVTGSISASKVELTDYIGTTLITWSTQDATTIPVVYVRVNLGPEKGMASGISGQASASWIKLGAVYDFLLYSNADKTELLDTVKVYVPALNESIGSNQIKEVSMSKVTGLSAALADISANRGDVYGGYAVVATSGGQYASPIAAITDLADWCGTPSVSNQCLIKIMPGSYDLGGAMLTLPSFVSMSGSGQTSTKLSKGNIALSGTNDLTNITLENITVNPPANGLISNVNIYADHSVYPAYGYGSIYAENNVENLTIDNVTVNVKNCRDDWYGIYLSTSNIKSDAGVKINNFHVVLDNLANNTYNIGIYLWGDGFVVNNSSVETIDGGLALRLIENSQKPDLVMNTTLNSPTLFDSVMGNGDNARCANVYDVQSGYTILPPNCK